MAPIETAPAYWAFLSYSHKDLAFARRLWRALERFPLPPQLAGRPNALAPGGMCGKRLAPVFRDRDETRASPALNDVLETALRRSGSLIVICSPDAAASTYVADEIRHFRRLGRDARIFAIVARGEADGILRGRPDQACLPPLLCHRIDADGLPIGPRVEPLAVDPRRGRDGWRQSIVKLAAAVLEVDFDQLWQRAQRRRRQQLTAWSAATLGLAAVMAGLGFRTLQQGEHRFIAEAQRRAIAAERLTAQGDAAAAVDEALAALPIDGPGLFRPAAPAAVTALRRSLWAPRAVLQLQPEQDWLPALAFAPNGQHVAVAGWSGRVHLLDIGSGTVSPLEGLTGSAKAVAFSPSGRLLAGGAVDGSLLVWDLATRSESRSLPPQSGAISGLAFASDGALLVISDDGQLRRLALAPGEHTVDRALTSASGTGTASTARFALSPDNKTIAVATGSLRLLDAFTLADRPMPDGFDGSFETVAFTPDGDRLISGPALALWDVGTGALLREVCGCDDRAEAVAVSPVGNLAAGAAYEGDVLLWDMDSKAYLTRLPGHGAPVTGLAFSPTGRELASSADDGSLIVWDVGGGDPWAVGADPSPIVIGASEQGPVWLSSTGAGFVVDGPGIAKGLPWPIMLPGEPTTVQVAPGGTRVAVGLADGTVCMFSRTAPSAHWCQRRHATRVNAVAWAPDGAQLASGGGQLVDSPENDVVVWNAADGALRLRFMEHRSRVVAVAFTADGQGLLSVSGNAVDEPDNRVVLWDMVSGTKSADRRLDYVGGNIALAADGVTIAVGAWQQVELLRLPELAPVATVTWDGQPVSALAFAAGDNLLGIGTGDGAVRIAQTVDGDVLAALRGHRRAIRWVGSTADGRQLASIDAEGTGRRWPLLGDLAATLAAATASRPPQ